MLETPPASRRAPLNCAGYRPPRSGSSNGGEAAASWSPASPTKRCAVLDAGRENISMCMCGCRRHQEEEPCASRGVPAFAPPLPRSLHTPLTRPAVSVCACLQTDAEVTTEKFGLEAGLWKVWSSKNAEGQTKGDQVRGRRRDPPRLRWLLAWADGTLRHFVKHEVKHELLGAVLPVALHALPGAHPAPGVHAFVLPYLPLWLVVVPCQPYQPPCSLPPTSPPPLPPPPSFSCCRPRSCSSATAPPTSSPPSPLPWSP